MTEISLKRPEDFTKRITIKMKDGSDFTLLVRNPSFEDQVRDNEGAGWKQRFKMIVGWEGINTEGENGPEPIAFTEENFQRVCENYPTVFIQATKAILDVMNDLGDPESGKSSGEQSPDSEALEDSQETKK